MRGSGARRFSRCPTTIAHALEHALDATRRAFPRLAAAIIAAVDTTLHFRRVGAEEADVLSLLWSAATARAASVSATDVERLRERLKRPGSVAVVAENEQGAVACGFATRLVLEDGSHSPDGAHISGFAVSPEHWGKGYGDATLGFLEQLLVTLGYEFAQLHVLEINSRARRLYERRGWRFLSAGHSHPDGDQAIYEKRLDGPSPAATA